MRHTIKGEQGGRRGIGGHATNLRIGEGRSDGAMTRQRQREGRKREEEATATATDATGAADGKAVAGWGCGRAGDRFRW